MFLRDEAKIKLITELSSRLFLKIKIMFHKLVNWSVYKNGITLYGIPRMIYRNNIDLKKNVKINENVFLHGAGKIEIQENSTLSYGTVVLSTGYETNSWVENSNENKEHLNKKVVIGRNVWIGANATILPGVTIADNCIIGAGAVVNKTLTEAGCLYAGVPARKIKKL